MYSKVTSARLYQQIVAQIEQSILEGAIYAGDRLPAEREMAEQFSVSRTAVREAVKALTEKGLVEIRPGLGTYVIAGAGKGWRNSLHWMVKSGVEDSQRNLVQVRAILEPEIAAIAAEMASEDDVGKLENAVAVMETALDDADTYIEADQQFHMALAHATRNQLIPTLLDPIVDLLREQRKRIFLVEGGSRRGQFHHNRILQAVRKHKPDAARQAMQAHLAQVRQDTEAENSENHSA